MEPKHQRWPTPKEWLILFPFYALYVFIVSKNFWFRPPPSDSLQYLQSAIYGNSYGFFPWLDRCVIEIIMGLAVFLPLPAYTSGPLAILILHVLTMAIGSIWSYRQVGIWGALFFSMFFATSWYTLTFGSQIFPECFLIFFSLVTFVIYNWTEHRTLKRVFWTGFFTAFAVFSKATGFVIPLFFAGCIWRNKGGLRDLSRYAMGILAGTFAVAFLFFLLYDWDSLTNMVSQFFAKDLQKNYVGRPEFNNLVTYYTVVADLAHFPIFLSMISFPLMFSRASSRPAALLGITIFMGLSAIFTFTQRGFLAIPNYSYAAYVFTDLGVATFLGDCVRETQFRLRSVVCFSIGIFVLVAVAFPVSFKNEPAIVFKPLLIDDNFRNFKFIFGVMIMALIYLTSATQIQTARKFILWFVGISVVWSTLYNAGNIKKVFDDVYKKESNFYYENADSINLVSTRPIDLYVEAWQEKLHPDRINWIYRVFFDRVTGWKPGPRAQWDHQRATEDQIYYRAKLAELAASKSPAVLTDSPNKVIEQRPSCRKESEHPWRDITLYALKCD